MPEPEMEDVATSAPQAAQSAAKNDPASSSPAPAAEARGVIESEQNTQ